ncbi:MAG TPA: hypothetical protein VNT60_04840 [Deinococcales bacterium]|nr:hypothetical protein [Deinococcales bacterium]
MPHDTTLEKISEISLYAPDLEGAVEHYRSLGLTLEWTAGPDGDRQGSAARLSFPQGGPTLLLHDDPRSQFTDVTVQVRDVPGFCRALAVRPEITWIRTPYRTGRGWSAVLRGPDRNVLVLASDAA